MPRMGNRVGVLSKIFANPDVPALDDYYEPFDYDYSHLKNAKEGQHVPTARPRSLITGQRMSNVNMGPNWEMILVANLANARTIRTLNIFKKRCMGNLKIHS